MKEYEGVLNAADEAVVFYSRHALELKRLPELKKEVVAKGFATNALEVSNDRTELEAWLQGRDYKNSIVLLMSSGNYDGLDIEGLAKRITHKES